MSSIKVKNIEDETVNIDVSSYPDYCPMCHRHQEPRFITGFMLNYQHSQLVFRCTSNNCLSFFIAYYFKSRIGDAFGLQSVRPGDPLPAVIEDEIKKLSPAFCQIYQQSHSAEAFGYGEVAGCGYRKALEFLIKDYCIKNNPAAENEIKEAWLGKVIDKYIDDSTIKACAEKATWLGNDETHYVRLWKEMDIKDLKEMLNLTKYWIVHKIKTESYLKKMSKSG